MATYTDLPLAAAQRLTRGHALPLARTVRGVMAGSVNSNYFIDLDDGRSVFARIYEEQDVEGVAFEWRVLEHLLAGGAPVPRRVTGSAPGEIRVDGKPTALFEVVGGSEVCQAMVDEARAREVGGLLGRLHQLGARFEERRAGRFTRADVRARLETVRRAQRPELEAVVRALEETLDEVDATFDDTLPSGLIHGDLFRDNVRWDGARVSAVLDWESASYGTFVYDVAVTLLAWCCGDALEPALMTAMLDGYRAARSASEAEARALRPALLFAAARFTTTRITDFHLREGEGQLKKDWRRFAMRLDAVRAFSTDALAAMMRPDLRLATPERSS